MTGNPTLAYLYRRFLARRLLEGLPAGRFLEIGVGSGDFYEELAWRGFSGFCLDLNSDLVREHQSSLTSQTNQIEFRTANFFSIKDQFNLVVAFEVLEHYEEDRLCLEKWMSLLKPEGRLIFSVPAHMRQWTVNDTRAGHARRYERPELMKKLLVSGFLIENFWCYGFPVLNFTYPLSSGLSRAEIRPADARGGPNPDLVALSAHASSGKHGGQASLSSDPLMTDFQRTSQSGTRRFPVLSKWLLHEAVWFPFLHMQRVALNGDLGTGYIVKCRKRT